MKKIIVLLVLSVFLSACNNKNDEIVAVIPEIEVIQNQEGEGEIQSPDTTEESQEDITVDTDIEDEIPALDLSTAIFSGNGTEPFWGFNASGSTLILREPSDTWPMDTTTYGWVVMTNVGSSVNMTASWMTLSLTLWTCSDGMSDIIYDYSSTFTAWPLNYIGCANVN